MSKHSKLNALLRMNWSTARNRLTRDLLFQLIKETPCGFCGKTMTREDFTIDHIKSWRLAADPVATFFDTDNCRYAHLSCNSRAGARTLHP